MSEKEQNNRWNSVLNFLCLEIFGEEVFIIYEKHHFAGHAINDNERPLESELFQFEKRFYDLIDAVKIYLKKNTYRLPRGEGDEKSAIVEALTEVFWAIIKLNHPEFFSAPNGIGIRDGYQIVALASPKHPFLGILPFKDKGGPL